MEVGKRGQDGKRNDKKNACFNANSNLKPGIWKVKRDINVNGSDREWRKVTLVIVKPCESKYKD